MGVVVKEEERKKKEEKHVFFKWWRDEYCEMWCARCATFISSLIAVGIGFTWVMALHGIRVEKKIKAVGLEEMPVIDMIRSETLFLVSATLLIVAIFGSYWFYKEYLSSSFLKFYNTLEMNREDEYYTLQYSIFLMKKGYLVYKDQTFHRPGDRSRESFKRMLCHAIAKREKLALKEKNKLN